jgi:hypothetical protein
MIEQVVNEPPNGARPSVREELEALRNAAEQKRWRDFIQGLPQVTQLFRDVTESIESDWHGMSDQDQDLILNIEGELTELVDSPPQPSFRERVWSTLSRTSGDERRQVRRLSAAIGAFMNAVGRQLRSEERVKRLLDTAAATNPDTIKRLELGTAEARAELVGAEFSTPEEFRTRFG